MTTATATTDGPAPLPAGRPASSPAIGAAAIIAALSLFWMATENHYGQCVAAQVAKYPAVPVSAFQTDDTGPLKVAYDKERQAAVGDCKRFIFI
ncbi:MAG: hypothetical protein J7513_05035 [Solirubrobacteraceae bacterium]|nr:hypothetical protein [Solirubrobacteraceae bacterium]